MPPFFRKYIVQYNLNDTSFNNFFLILGTMEKINEVCDIKTTIKTRVALIEKNIIVVIQGSTKKLNQVFCIVVFQLEHLMGYFRELKLL